MALRGIATQQSQEPGRQTKQSSQLSLFPIKMIAKLQNPVMGVTINNESTTTESPP